MPLDPRALVTTATANSILTIRNPAGDGNSLTVQAQAGGTEPAFATLITDQIR